MFKLCLIKKLRLKLNSFVHIHLHILILPAVPWMRDNVNAVRASCCRGSFCERLIIQSPAAALTDVCVFALSKNAKQGHLASFRRYNFKNVFPKTNEPLWNGPRRSPPTWSADWTKLTLMCTQCLQINTSKSSFRICSH